MPVGNSKLAMIEIEKFLGVRIGESAPDFSVTTIGGEQVSLAGLKGKVVLLDFWATWCTPCIAQMAHLRKVHDRFAPSGDFVIVGISLDDSEQSVRSFTKKQHMPWHVAVQGPAESNPVAKAYNVSQIPAMFLVDREGKVAVRDVQGWLVEGHVARLLGAADSQAATAQP